MIIYKDIVSGDELFSDSGKFEIKDDAYYYVSAKLIQIGAEEVDDSLLGGNKSAEAEDEAPVGGDPNLETKIDIVHRHRLVETGFGSKKEYGGYMKKFLTKVKNNLIEQGTLKDDEESVKAWQKTVQGNVKKHILDVFSDLQFFMGESMDGEGCIVAVNYDDAGKPVVIIMKDSVIGEKV